MKAPDTFHSLDSSISELHRLVINGRYVLRERHTGQLWLTAKGFDAPVYLYPAHLALVPDAQREITRLSFTEEGYLKAMCDDSVIEFAVHEVSKERYSGKLLEQAC